MEVIDHFHSRIPILGVCLGHQALGMYFGATLEQVPPMHGKTSELIHTQHPLFADIPSPFTAMRYHSLALTEYHNPSLETIATADDGTIMALAHSKYKCLGVQFHPESIGTEHGLQMLKNWAGIY
jgi:anthranilate synthase/aminodeoxychorismate synthase-like glutamine amidotransferase